MFKFKIELPGVQDEIRYTPVTRITFDPDAVPVVYRVEARPLHGRELIPLRFEFAGAGHVHSSHLVEIARYLDNSSWDLHSMRVDSLDTPASVEDIMKLLEPLDWSTDLL